MHVFLTHSEFLPLLLIPHNGRSWFTHQPIHLLFAIRVYRTRLHRPPSILSKVDLKIEDVQVKLWQRRDIELTLHLNSLGLSSWKRPDERKKHLFDTLRLNLNLDQLRLASRKWNLFDLEQISFFGQLEDNKDFDM